MKGIGGGRGGGKGSVKCTVGGNKEGRNQKSQGDVVRKTRKKNYYTTLHSISQLKRHREARANKWGRRHVGGGDRGV